LIKLTQFDQNDKYDPCTPDYVHSYLNRAEVQKALHAVPIHWEKCRYHIIDMQLS